jgi:hypothetical protein
MSWCAWLGSFNNVELPHHGPMNVVPFLSLMACCAAVHGHHVEERWKMDGQPERGGARTNRAALFHCNLSKRCLQPNEAERDNNIMGNRSGKTSAGVHDEHGGSGLFLSPEVQGE